MHHAVYVYTYRMSHFLSIRRAIFCFLFFLLFFFNRLIHFCFAFGRERINLPFEPRSCVSGYPCVPLLSFLFVILTTGRGARCDPWNIHETRRDGTLRNFQKRNDPEIKQKKAVSVKFKTTELQRLPLKVPRPSSNSAVSLRDDVHSIFCSNFNCRKHSRKNLPKLEEINQDCKIFWIYKGGWFTCRESIIVL